MKKGFHKYHADKIPLYHGFLHVLVGHDLAETSRAAGLPDTDINNLPLRHYVAYAFTGERDGELGYFAVFQPDSPAGTIAHEAVHLVNKIFNDRGVKLDQHNDEAQAYLMEWIVNCMNYALTSPEVKPVKAIKLL